MATIDQVSLYNNALVAIGERKLSSISEDREPRHKLDTIWNLGAVEYCLDLIKPHWATTVVKLNSPSASAQHDLDEVHTLPAAYLSLVGLYSDSKLDQPVNRYIIEGRTIACEYDPVYLRYVSNAPASSFTNWTPNFAQVVVAYLAKELAATYAPSRRDELRTSFESAVQAAIQVEGFKEPGARSSRTTNTLNAPWLKVYNDALQIMGLPHMVDAFDDSAARVALDVALNNDLVQDLLEEYSWHFPSKIVKIDYDPSLETDWGYEYAFNKPADMVRFMGIFTDDRQKQPLKRYHDESGNFYADVTEIYIHYISDDDLDNPANWPVIFRKLVAAQMARDAAPSIPMANIDNVMYVHKDRIDTAQNTDAFQSPPQVIGQGAWVSSRGAYRNSGRGRP